MGHPSSPSPSYPWGRWHGRLAGMGVFLFPLRFSHLLFNLFFPKRTSQATRTDRWRSVPATPNPPTSSNKRIVGVAFLFFFFSFLLMLLLQLRRLNNNNQYRNAPMVECDIRSRAPSSGWIDWDGAICTLPISFSFIHETRHHHDRGRECHGCAGRDLVNVG